MVCLNGIVVLRLVVVSASSAVLVVAAAADRQGALFFFPAVDKAGPRECLPCCCCHYWPPGSATGLPRHQQSWTRRAPSCASVLHPGGWHGSWRIGLSSPTACHRGESRRLQHGRPPDLALMVDPPLGVVLRWRKHLLMWWHRGSMRAATSFRVAVVACKPGGE